MECNFTVGQKVVCVDADWPDFLSPLSEGQIYTVKAVGLALGLNPDFSITYEPNIELVEQANPDDDSDRIAIRIGRGFRASRFRPAVVRKTDISIFKAMLNPSKEQVSA